MLTMANPQHLGMLMRGAKIWNEWRLENSGIKPDLGGADLGGADLGGANLSQADLSEADLGGANLIGSDLTGANLTGADLRGAGIVLAKLVLAKLTLANLTGASLRASDLTSANLRDANLSQADLVLANLFSAKLGGSDFNFASVGHTVFGNVVLSTVRNLETVRHEAPSSIGIDTIYLSKGNIPEAFLRGAGVPDDFIDHMHSLAPSEFYSCFISYSSKDQEFAKRLHADLQGKRVRCWIAPHDVQGGRKLPEQIDVAIQQHEKLLLILSSHSMKSEWVKTEIAKARKREVQEKNRVLFPLSLCLFETLRDWECFDSDTGKDSAREIREYFIPDFSNWEDHDSYQEAFGRLLRDLKAKKAEKAED